MTRIIYYNIQYIIYVPISIGKFNDSKIQNVQSIYSIRHDIWWLILFVKIWICIQDS